MRNVDIIYKAKSLVSVNKRRLFPVFVFIGLVGVIPSLISEPIITLILTLILIPIQQGYITSTFKLYDQDVSNINTYEDGLYGLLKWPQLFSTYFMYHLFKIIIFIIETLIAMLIMMIFFGKQIQGLISQFYWVEQMLESSMFGMDTMALSFLGNFIGSVLLIVFLFLALYFITSIVYDLCFFPTFYLVQEDTKGIAAMKKAYAMMDGHKWQLFTLKLSFFGWAILAWLLIFLMGCAFALIIPNVEIYFILTLVLGVAVSAWIYHINYQTALTVFYKEVLGEPEEVVFEEKDIDQMSDMDEFEAYVTQVLDKEEIDIVDDQMTVEENDDGFYDRFGMREMILGLCIYLPLYFIFARYIVSYIFQFFIYLFSLNDMNVINAWFNFAIDGILCLIGFFMFTRYFKEAWQYFKELSGKTKLKIALAGYGIIYLISFITNLIIQLIDFGSQSANQMNVETIMAAAPLPMIIAVVVFAPIIEELVFRGIIFRSLRKFNVPLAIIVSGFLFGFIHVSSAVFAGDFSQLLQVLPYMAMGIVFAYSYEKSKSISVPIYLHMINNLVSVLLIFLVQ